MDAWNCFQIIVIVMMKKKLFGSFTLDLILTWNVYLLVFQFISLTSPSTWQVTDKEEHWHQNRKHFRNWFSIHYIIILWEQECLTNVNPPTTMMKMAGCDSKSTLYNNCWDTKAINGTKMIINWRDTCQFFRITKSTVTFPNGPPLVLFLEVQSVHINPFILLPWS